MHANQVLGSNTLRTCDHSPAHCNIRLDAWVVLVVYFVSGGVAVVNGGVAVANGVKIGFALVCGGITCCTRY